jgi:segregation and condensation protein A
LTPSLPTSEKTCLGEPVQEPVPNAPPIHEPGPDPAPVVDPTPNPDPHPDDPDPEPDRDPHPDPPQEPPAGPDPDSGDLPRTDPPATPDTPPLKLAAAPSAVEPPPLVLTSKPVPAEKPIAKPSPKPRKPEQEAEHSPFSVSVGQVYDGPLDLLLDLIRKQDIDIYDIPIARITAQFLAYVNQLKAGDMDVAGEFIYTASLLIHIKSKMLLPRAPSGPEDAAEDPRRELVERLLEHERFKNAAQMLQQKQMLEAATWTNPGLREFKDDVAAEPEIAADTDDLVRIFRDIIERARSRPTFNVQDDSVTVGQMIQFLGRRLALEDRPISLRKLLSHSKSERALVAMFLALLELVRLQAVLLRQDRAFSEIFIKKHSSFDAVMNEGLASARDDWR